MKKESLIKEINELADIVSCKLCPTYIWALMSVVTVYFYEFRNNYYDKAKSYYCKDKSAFECIYSMCLDEDLMMILQVDFGEKSSLYRFRLNVVNDGYRFAGSKNDDSYNLITYATARLESEKNFESIVILHKCVKEGLVVSSEFISDFTESTRLINLLNSMDFSKRTYEKLFCSAKPLDMLFSGYSDNFKDRLRECTLSILEDCDA